MRKIIFIFLLAAMTVSSVVAQKKREISTPVTVNYCLPKVSYVVKVKLEYTRLIPGPYWQNAEKELGMKPEIREPEEQWKLVGIEIRPQYIPDEEAMYAMTTSGDYNPIMLSLSPEGFLAGVSAGPMPIAVKDGIMKYEAFTKDTEEEVDITSLNTYNPLKEILDTNYTYQEIDGVMKKIWDPIVRYTAKSKADNMAEAVKEIFRIRSERTKLVAAENEVPDGRSLDIILKEFDRMENDYLSLFMGKRTQQQLERTFVVTPKKVGEAVLAFRFSESEGIAARKNVSATAYTVVVDDVTIPAAPGTSAEVQPAVASVYYRVPAVGNIKLMKANEELESFMSVIPQLGVIKTFPTDVIGNENLMLEFYPEYGSLKSVSKNK